MCCLIPGTPIEDERGRYKTFLTGNKFQTDMLNAPCVNCPWSCCWFSGQFIYITGGITQYCLRYKALEGDMSKYECCQGYFNGCGFKAGSCGESSCPECCLFCEACFCNGCAVSASRAFVQEKYDLASDPCDYRLIRFSNCLAILSCICDIAAIIDPSFRELARIVDFISDLVYHCVTGCMTAQVAYELDYQKKIAASAPPQEFAAKATPVDY